MSGHWTDIPEVRLVPIVLKKSFFADDLKFSGLLARLSRCGVRDHINYSKNDRWRSYRFYRALQRLKSPIRYICEIFGAPRFRVFQHYLPEAVIRSHRPHSAGGLFGQPRFPKTLNKQL